MKVRWTPRAIDDLAAIEAHVARADPSAAARLVERLFAAGESLARFPKRGRVVPEMRGSGLRELLRGSYRIVYRLRSGGPEILVVFHARRTFPEDLP